MRLFALHSSSCCKDSAPIVYEQATDVGHVSSPIIDQDLELLEPFIRLQATYEDAMKQSD